MNRIRIAVTAATIAAALSLPVARSEAGGALSEASQLSGVGTASVVAGSMLAVVGSVSLVVESIEWTADGARCAFRGSAEVGRVILILPAKAVGGVSLVVGQTVQITTAASGWLVTKAGEVIAFIPNAAGRALLFSEPVGSR